MARPFRLTRDAIAPDAALSMLAGAEHEPGRDGAASIFLGTVRRTSGPEGGHGRVLGIEYEAYDRMAGAEWERIAAEVCARYPTVSGIACVHRVGWVPIGETSIAVAATSPHRREAQDAVRDAVDLLKARLPVWKKERYQDGSAWISEVGSG